MSLFGELQRRNVFRVALGYFVSCWLLLQVADLVLDNIGAPDWVMQSILLVLTLGFPVVIFFSWVYEVTPEGLKRESEIDRAQSITHITANKLDRVNFVILLLAVGYFVFDRAYLSDSRESGQPQAQAQVPAEPKFDREQPLANPEPSIAVLPFVNMSGDAGNEYFSDGLSEEILNLLTKVSGLKVTARTSSFAFKGKNQDLREMGDALGVTNVLEGSVRKSGERVRITAQLINVDDGTHIWSDSYDRTLTDIFEIQSDVAAAIVDALKLHVGNAPDRGQPTESIEAYDLFLQARSTFATGNPTDMVDAASRLRAAIELDPKFAEAYELLAGVYWYLAGTVVKSGEGQRLTFDASRRALELNPELTKANALYRSADLENYSWLGEIEAFEQAVQEQPSNTELLDVLVFDLIEAGYLNEAARYAERLITLDPLSQYARNRYAESLATLGYREEAMAYPFPMTRGNLFAAAGQFDRAAKHFAEVPELDFLGGVSGIEQTLLKIQNPVSGQSYLDGLIAEKVSNLPDDERLNEWINLVTWYPIFGYLDRYFELIYSTDITSSTWTDADWLVYMGTVLREYTGFTAHPEYVNVAEAIGLTDVWDERGPPDFCQKTDGQWVCE